MDIGAWGCRGSRGFVFDSRPPGGGDPDPQEYESAE
jgi:hypothetical protein